MAAPFRLVIFDVDGTLVDSQHHIVEAQRRAFSALGLPVPTRERSLSVVGLSLAEAFAVLVGEQGPIAALVEGYKAAWFALRQEPGYREPLYTGAAATIAALSGRSGVVLGLATGKSRKGVDRLLAAQNWNSVFATVQTADDHPSKPDPAMLRAALAETSVPASAAVLVGDTTYDIAMAMSAGVRAIGVSWGYHEAAALTDAGAACIARDFADLDAMLADLTHGPPPPRQERAAPLPLSGFSGSQP